MCWWFYIFINYIVIATCLLRFQIIDILVYLICGNFYINGGIYKMGFYIQEIMIIIYAMRSFINFFWKSQKVS